MHTTTDLPPTSSWRLWALTVLAVALCGLIALGLRHAQVLSAGGGRRPGHGILVRRAGPPAPDRA
ncbi:hypothetical protein LP420_13665 [Massilia sp. B-10]|nr:hypothetical protein LP420_13665 [Massilia sp. B-10]